MARDLFEFIVDAVVASIHRIGTTPAGVVYGLAGGLAFYFVKRSGVQMRNLIEALVVGFACWLPFFVFELARIPYDKFQLMKTDLASLQASNSGLKAVAERRRHYMDEGEPAFENAMKVEKAFSRWRKSLGEQSGMLLITADDDPQARRLMSAFTGAAVAGANLENGNLQNIGIKPEHTKGIEKAASKDGMLVIHALPEVPQVLQLVDGLSSTVYRLDRSYEMPPTPQPLPSNVLWLHFGKGVKWSSEYWDEEAAKKRVSK